MILGDIGTRGALNMELCGDSLTIQGVCGWAKETGKYRNRVGHMQRILGKTGGIRTIETGCGWLAHIFRERNREANDWMERVAFGFLRAFGLFQ